MGWVKKLETSESLKPPQLFQRAKTPSRADRDFVIFAQSGFAFGRQRLTLAAPSHSHMFANLLQFLEGRSPSPEVVRYAFVEHVEVRQREPRNAKVERLIC